MKHWMMRRIFAGGTIGHEITMIDDQVDNLMIKGT
jgi:hypothetical protein